MTTQGIDDVIAEMDVLLDRAIAANDPRGYFTCVYRAVTARVRDGIAAGEFIDNDRMEHFDVIFARFYLDAHREYDRGGNVSASWRTAFDHAQAPLLILQHVLLGMNAHINLDLGVAAAHTLPGARIVELEDDFMRINHVLGEMVDQMQAAISAVSPWTSMVDRIGYRFDEAITSWSLDYARDRAWRFALDVATADDDRLLRGNKDIAVATLSNAIAKPRAATRCVCMAAKRRERADVGAIAAALRDGGAPLPSV